MKIAISGAHGQGKTTLIEALTKQDIFKDFTFAKSPTREIANICPIGMDGTGDTQMLIMTQHYANSLKDNIILDRCALDGWAYTRVFYKTICHPLFVIIEQMFDYIIHKYDIIFYIEPELPLISDGVRPVDMLFFNQVRRQFEEIIKTKKVKIVSLSGSVEQRVTKVIDTYNIRKQFN